MKIPFEIQKLRHNVTKYRRELHQIPELGLNEIKTARYLREKLTSFGIKEIDTMIETGTIAVFHGRKPGKTLAFRTDIDGLPVTEETGVDYASQTFGKMHACGHDGHMATMLGFAQYLSEHPEIIKGTIVLIFQPAEEGPGGAQLMIEAGLIEKYQIEQIIGLHVFPDLLEGTIGCRPGPMMARNGEVNIQIKGKSSHGAQPHKGADAILAAAAVIQGLHTILSRNISPMENAVLTFGKIQGGEAMNIIPGAVFLEGTMRAFNDDVYQTMTDKIVMITQSIAAGYGCEAIVEFNHMYRVVKNDTQMVNALQEIVGESYIEVPPYMLAEDFSMYQQVVPGLFFFVGIRNDEKGYTYPLHSNKMQFDEENLLAGITCYVALIDALN
ncbi:amidohydrolase [Enterococcus saccharolyticus]|uniref:Amidohydrolase n=1 Tax=Candidatus Enterococcus willemsii TaxID=1857215 RepID=A0ABQ6YXP3_9ENTE|nr:MULTISPECIES: amidohydrolase [Enterococcus]KAF1302753.1 amidohydrolase [Enterococcus sp. CU12B]MCD5002431.1 amidohydrolase [Enterococcus saccharolyticus]